MDIQVLRSVAEIRRLRRELRDVKLGFVPTMGALHDGHLGIVRQALKECDKVIVSVYVNPSQFAPNEDFDKYPRTPEADIEKLKGAGAHYVFLPDTKELYHGRTKHPLEEGTIIHVKGLSHQLEGSVRPTFFMGVATVVCKLLNIVQPDYFYLGQKDGQQCVVVANMIRDLFIPTELHVVPTAREDDGLARSSRNVYLSPEERRIAPLLYQGLCAAEKQFAAGERRTDVLRQCAQDHIKASANDLITVQYIDINCMDTLDAVPTIEPGKRAMLSGAMLVGKTRIIDNIVLG